MIEKFQECIQKDIIRRECCILRYFNSSVLIVRIIKENINKAENIILKITKVLINKIKNFLSGEIIMKQKMEHV